MHHQHLTTRIVHLLRRSLIVEVPGHMVSAMFDRLITRQIAALVIALGVFLSGAAPAWAGATMSGGEPMSSGMEMMMPGMDMQSNCMPDNSLTGKQAPCKSTDNSCTICVGCAVNVGLAPQFSMAALAYHRTTGLFVADAKPDSLTTAPDLPPPILRA
jgi:hypothetical protein